MRISAPRERPLPGTRTTKAEMSVAERSLAPGIPTCTVRVDEELLEEIAELTGIAFWALDMAFAGEPKDLALDVIKTAVAENTEGTPEEWRQHVLAWAKENGSGEYAAK